MMPPSATAREVLPAAASNTALPNRALKHERLAWVRESRAWRIVESFIGWLLLDVASRVFLCTPVGEDKSRSRRRLLPAKVSRRAGRAQPFATVSAGSFSL